VIQLCTAKMMMHITPFNADNLGVDIIESYAIIIL